MIVGGVFNSGLLIDPDLHPTYDYAPAQQDVVMRARAMRAACERHGVRLAAAAIQFALNHPAVDSVVVGARSAAELHADVDDAQVTIPGALWDELEGL